MVRRGQEARRAVRPHGPVEGGTDNLPYCIELWNSAHTAVEQTLARAASAPLAQAIFKAARTEHPDRRVTLRRSTRIIADSAD